MQETQLARPRHFEHAGESEEEPEFCPGLSRAQLIKVFKDTAKGHVVELLDDSTILIYVSLNLQIPRMSEIEVTGFLSTFVASLIAGVFVKVASGPSKTTGLAKFQSDFTGLAVSFFWAVTCVSQSRFFS